MRDLGGVGATRGRGRGSLSGSLRSDFFFLEYAAAGPSSCRVTRFSNEEEWASAQRISMMKNCWADPVEYRFAVESVDAIFKQRQQQSEERMAA